MLFSETSSVVQLTLKEHIDVASSSQLVLTFLSSFCYKDYILLTDFKGYDCCNKGLSTEAWDVDGP